MATKERIQGPGDVELLARAVQVRHDEVGDEGGVESAEMAKHALNAFLASNVTLTNEVAATVKEYKAGKIEFRVDKFGIVHAVVGKLSFDETQLVENADALTRLIESLRPSSAKGIYIRTLTLSATMTPGIAIAA